MCKYDLKANRKWVDGKYIPPPPKIPEPPRTKYISDYGSTMCKGCGGQVFECRMCEVLNKPHIPVPPEPLNGELLWMMIRLRRHTERRTIHLWIGGKSSVLC